MWHPYFADAFSSFALRSGIGKEIDNGRVFLYGGEKGENDDA